jgi:hypothetical protein
MAQIINWRVWAPLLLGLIIGVVIGGSVTTTQNLTSGWAGLLIGAIAGAIFAIAVEWIPRSAKQIAMRRTLCKVLGPMASDTTTIYVGPFARPMDSKLYRLDRKSPFGANTLITGSELVVGYGDTVALSYAYATLLKSGKQSTEITINQDADMERGTWGMNFITIGAANARTIEVLGCFQNTFFTFDDNFSSIVRGPRVIDKVTQNTRDDGTTFELRFRNKVISDGNKDYGLILKLKDEACDDTKRIIIIAGIGGDGTAGAAFYLWRNFERLAHLGDTFGVLIETKAGPASAHLVNFDEVATLRRVQ